MRLSPGSPLGPYEISGPIGAGGMGEVYRARDTRLGREVAIKVLPREVTTDRDRLARFEREARSSSALNHPNIVTIHDFATAGSDTYLVMELIRGESLRDLIARGPVPYRKLVAIGAGIADGLAAAHAAGLIHRDLKPENVMITADGVAKILDFGLVKAAQPAADISSTEVKGTTTGVVLGTAMYMAPEQARGAAVGIECDQFALGLILHEMATGSHPFRRENPYATVTAILTDDPPPLEPSFPESFVWIVERCLAKEPGQRYASTSDLARDLKTLRDRGRAIDSRREVPRNARRPIAIALLISALLLAAAVWAALGMRRGTVERGYPIHVAVPTPQIDVRMSEVAVPVVISPDGRKLLVTGIGANGTNDLWLYDLAADRARLIAESAFAPAWSNDSRAFAYFSGGKLMTMPAEGGPPTTVCDASPEGTPSWHGDTIIFSRYSGGPERAGAYRVKATGGAPEKITSVGPVAWWPHFLPDGKRFLYITLDPNTVVQTLMIGSLDGSTPVRVDGVISKPLFVDGYLLFIRDGTLLAQPFDDSIGRLTGEPRRLAENVDYFRSTGMTGFSASNNGVLAWRHARRSSRLAWLDRNGMETGTIATEVFDLDGRLSLDGTRYAVGVIDPKLGISDVWVYDLARESAERITFGIFDEKAPLWAPDMRTLYYRTDGFGGPPDVARIEPGAGRGKVVFSGRSVEHPEDVSRDGKWLLFTIYEHVTSDIYVMPLDPPGPPRPFANTPFTEASARFSPDGRWVAYTSNLSGRSEVYVRAFDGATPALRVSRDGGSLPRWKNDGKELFFLGPAGRLMSATFDGSAGAPRMLFQAASAVSFEPSPDGSRFLMHLDEHREPPVHLMLNWQAMLKN